MHTPRFHTLFDLASARDDLSEPLRLKAILKELAAVVEMSVLAGPLIAEGHPDNPGTTGFVVVDYSHISIHTFTKYSEALIDIFSCKPYDKEKVRVYLQKECCIVGSEIREQEVRWEA